jgi:hypothetical protein
MRCVDKHVVGAFIPVLAEGRAAHTDDGDLVLYAM